MNIAAGEPHVCPRTTVYQPDIYSDLWDPLFPIHDYPWQSAQVCVDLFEETGDPIFQRGILRWIQHLATQLPARKGAGAYAEHYGRALHFLVSARPLGVFTQAAELIARLRAEIYEHLEVEGRLRSHPEEDRCDAVDGMGFLLWGLLEVDQGKRIRSDFDVF